MSTRLVLALVTVLLLWLGKLLPRAAALPGGLRLFLAGYVAILLAWIALLICTKEPRISAGLGTWQARWLVIGVVVGLALFIVSGLGYVVSRQVLGLVPPGESEIMPESLGARWMLMLGMVLAAAGLEEWLFRGLLLDALADLPGWGAVVTSAAAFALYHLSPFQFLPTLLLGIGLGATVLFLGSLWPAVVAHAAFNFLGLLAFTLNGGPSPGG